MKAENVFAQNKKLIRKQILGLRDKQKNKEELSQKIVEKVFAMSDFKQANTVLIYLDIKSEVRTRPHLPHFLATGKIIVVPYVSPRGLELFHLEDLTELADGTFGVLEPVAELRLDLKKKVSPEEIDLALIPGIAFDSEGARLGYGKGYYDKLLCELRLDCLMVGLAFECQIHNKLPQEEHDINLDFVLTEDRIIT
jgi:5-formyltetrahydrofolate cyclo-ligase